MTRPRAERAWADLLAALDDLERNSRRAGIAGCEAVADAAEACLEAAERRTAAATRALERGLEQTLAVLAAPERTARTASDQPARWPEGFVRLTDAADRPITGPEAAVGTLTVTFADGRSLAVTPVDPTIH